MLWCAEHIAVTNRMSATCRCVYALLPIAAMRGRICQLELEPRLVCSDMQLRAKRVQAVDRLNVKHASSVLRDAEATVRL
jgi:hypothetical protein